MTTYLLQEEIININQKISEEMSKISILRQNINIHIANISMYQDILKSRCKHTKMRDTTIVSEHSEYYCSVCNINL